MPGIKKSDAADPAVYIAAACENTQVATPYAMRLIDGVLQEWLTLHLSKNFKYRKVSNDLGARGVFPDINRKVGIIKDRVWDGGPVVGEGTIEVIDDLIGHLFLMRDMIIQENAKDWGWDDDGAPLSPSLSPNVRAEQILKGQDHKLGEAADRLSSAAHGWRQPRPVKDQPQA